MLLLKFQIIHNSSYIPEQLVIIALIVMAIPIQFLLLVIIAFSPKRNLSALVTTSVLFFMARTLLLWFTYIQERATYSTEQVYNATEKYDYQQGISTSVGYTIKLL